MSGITAATPVTPPVAVATRKPAKAKPAATSTKTVEVRYTIPMDYREWLNKKAAEIRTNRTAAELKDRAGFVYPEHLIQVAIEFLMDSETSIGWSEVTDANALRKALGLDVK
jgi:hypothetical protein